MPPTLVVLTRREAANSFVLTRREAANSYKYMNNFFLIHARVAHICLCRMSVQAEILPAALSTLSTLFTLSTVLAFPPPPFPSSNVVTVLALRLVLALRPRLKLKDLLRRETPTECTNAFNDHRATTLHCTTASLSECVRITKEFRAET